MATIEQTSQWIIATVFSGRGLSQRMEIGIAITSHRGAKMPMVNDRLLFHLGCGGAMTLFCLKGVTTPVHCRVIPLKTPQSGVFGGISRQ